MEGRWNFFSEKRPFVTEKWINGNVTYTKNKYFIPTYVSLLWALGTHNNIMLIYSLLTSEAKPEAASCPKGVAHGREVSTIQRFQRFHLYLAPEQHAG